MQKITRGFLLAVVSLGIFGVVSARQAGKEKNAYILTVVATNPPDPERRTVQCLTSGDYFVDILIPSTLAVTRAGQPGKRLPLSTIAAATKMTCRGDWTDATRSVFRASSVTLVGKVARGELDRRFAAACGRLKSAPPRPTTPAPSAADRNVADQFVIQSVTLERRDDLPVQPGTGYAAYAAEGEMRNISGSTYERVEVQMSILDRDHKKVADQTAVGANVRTGDRWKFQGTPPLYLASKNAHTVRVERITGTVKR